MKRNRSIQVVSGRHDSTETLANPLHAHIFDDSGSPMRDVVAMSIECGGFDGWMTVKVTRAVMSADGKQQVVAEGKALTREETYGVAALFVEAYRMADKDGEPA